MFGISGAAGAGVLISGIAGGVTTPESTGLCPISGAPFAGIPGIGVSTVVPGIGSAGVGVGAIGSTGVVGIAGASVDGVAGAIGSTGAGVGVIGSVAAGVIGASVFGIAGVIGSIGVVGIGASVAGVVGVVLFDIGSMSLNYSKRIAVSIVCSIAKLL